MPKGTGIGIISAMKMHSILLTEPERDRLEEMAEQLRLESRVVFAGLLEAIVQQYDEAAELAEPIPA